MMGRLYNLSFPPPPTRLIPGWVCIIFDVLIPIQPLEPDHDR